MAIKPEVKLLAVRYGTPEEQCVLDYPAEGIIPVSDESQFIDLLCTGQRPQIQDKSGEDKKNWKDAITERDETQEEGKWYRFKLEHAFKTYPLLTTVEIPFKVPKNTALRLYLVPSRVFSVADIQAMLEDIREELKVDAAWNPSSPHGRSIVTVNPSSFELEDALLRAVEVELNAAGLVRRMPYCELNQRVPLPENAIVSHWALKRISDLKSLSAEAARNAAAQELRAANSPNDKREEEAKKEAARYRDLAQEAMRLLSRAARHIDPAELNTPLPFGPAAQRDHRLRRLLRAFAAPSMELPTAQPGREASYPISKYGSIYELWCAVAMVKRLRRAGFSVDLIQATPGIKSRAYQWRCALNDLMITLDFEPLTVPLRFENIPPARRRSVPAWQHEVQATLQPGQFFSCSGKCTPDYLIRIEKKDSATLLVGDASAVNTVDVMGEDSAERKTAKVSEYVRNMGWVRNENVFLRPSPLGGFALHPGAQSAWDDMPVNPSGPDVAVFGFHPGEVGLPGLDAWCEYVLGQVGG